MLVINTNVYYNVFIYGIILIKIVLQLIILFFLHSVLNIHIDNLCLSIKVGKYTFFTLLLYIPTSW